MELTSHIRNVKNDWEKERGNTEKEKKACH
jgi:hypothetical protein